MPIDRFKFRELVAKYLLPLFSGARLEDEFMPSTGSHALVSFEGICSLKIKPYKDCDYCAVINRSQPFAQSSSQGITEFQVCKSFIEILGEYASGIGEPFEEDLLSRFTIRFIARSLYHDESWVLEAIDKFDEWSTRQYEGQAITSAIGFRPIDKPGEVCLRHIWPDDYSAVLTNGVDTLLVSSYQGQVQGYETLSVTDPLPLYVPHRLAPIAEWTGNNRLAVVLNRAGEILLIHNKQLTFARRGGRWHFLTHVPIITMMRAPQDREVRRAVYASYLDASFARTGACVGLLTSGNVGRLDEIAPEHADHIWEPSSPKARLIRQIVGRTAFQDLDRRFRQELLAIDGATILDHHGMVLAVGAILSLPGGSIGGGRLAAAAELSKYGTGIKVSQDGGITGFKHCEAPDTAHPDFLMM
jgi:hypothetical protein